MNGTEYEEIRGVRVRYSTIVNYISHIYRLGIAVLFAVIITRRLSVTEYGLFTTIIALATMFTSIYDIWNFWIIRYYARKRYDFVSSCFFINTLYTPLAFSLFLIISHYYVELLSTEYIYFIIGSISIVTSLFFTYFRSISLSSKPFIEGKVSIVEHSVRIALAYLLVVVLSLKLLGALVSFILTITMGLPIYILFFKKYGIYVPKLNFNTKDILLVIKNSYISTISTLYEFLRQIERPLLTALTNSTVAAAYIGVSYVPRSVILQSSSAFTASLIARLLRKPVSEDVEYVLRISFLINTSLLLVLILFSRSLLSLFRGEYVEVDPLFMVFSLESFIYIFLSIFVSIASSIEREDLEKFGLGLKDTALFKLRFYMFTTGLIVILLSSSTTTIFLSMGFSNPVILCLPYPIAWLFSTIVLTIYSYKVALKKIKFSLPWREILYASVSSLTTGLLINSLGYTNIAIRSVWTDLPKLVSSITLVLSIYFSIILILSKWFREFIKTIIKYSLKTLFRTI